MKYNEYELAWRIRVKKDLYDFNSWKEIDYVQDEYKTFQHWLLLFDIDVWNYIYRDKNIFVVQDLIY